MAFGMKFNPHWFGQAKMIVIEATALISLGLVAVALILNEIKHLF
jgi:hypothetical protein